MWNPSVGGGGGGSSSSSGGGGGCVGINISNKHVLPLAFILFNDTSHLYSFSDV
jgi:hypothetical protein